MAYTDGKYMSFPDAPPPLEDTGGPQVKDISGSVLPGISKWALSFGGEGAVPAHDLRAVGQFFAARGHELSIVVFVERQRVALLIVDGYALLNARIGVRWSEGWASSLWSRNLLDKNYYELLTAAPGNTGLYVGQPGDATDRGADDCGLAFGK